MPRQATLKFMMILRCVLPSKSLHKRPSPSTYNRVIRMEFRRCTNEARGMAESSACRMGTRKCGHHNLDLHCVTFDIEHPTSRFGTGGQDWRPLPGIRLRCSVAEQEISEEKSLQKLLSSLSPERIHWTRSSSPCPGAVAQLLHFPSTGEPAPWWLLFLGS